MEANPTSPDIVVVAVDGLRASALGAYGNTWYPTPQFDQLACQSLLCEWCFASSLELRLTYRALWQGLHPARPLDDKTHDDTSLAQFLRKVGYQTRLVAESGELLDFAGANDFDEAALVDRPTGARPADDPAETRMAELFATSGEVFRASQSSSQQPLFLWIHSSGMYGPWEAPVERRVALADEDDPQPFTEVDPPQLRIDLAEDPDEPFTYACAYAAQVWLLDMCLGGFLELVQGNPKGRDCVLVVVGLRGFGLGEHGQIGGNDPTMSVEQVQVPLIIRQSGPHSCHRRVDNLCEHVDVWTTLCHFAGTDARQDGGNLASFQQAVQVPWRDRSLAIGPTGDTALRSHHWCLKNAAFQDIDDLGQPSSLAKGAISHSLFARPDDRFEANDVAQLRPDVVDALSEARQELARLAASGELLEPNLLPEILTMPHD